MKMCRLFVLLLCALPWSFLQAAPILSPGDQPAVNAPLAGADEQTYFGPPQEPPVRLPAGTLDDPIGALYQAGTTWYDYQHNGSAGKMISVDDNGFVHLVWMKGMQSDIAGARRIYYNVWDPATQTMVFQTGGVPTGIQVDGQLRAGYTSQALLPDGWCFPAFHQGTTGVTGIHAGAAMDFAPHAGAFTTTEPAYLIEGGQPLQLVWPKIAVSGDSVFHAVMEESPYVAGTIPMRIYYARGTASWDQGGNGEVITWQTVAPGNQQYMFVDSSTTVAADIAASKISDRVAMAWSRFRISNSDQFNDDLYIMISEDGGQNWGPRVNLTNFASADTHRVYADCSVMFDENDILHVAFTSGYYLESTGGINAQKSMIWHWDEMHQHFSPVAWGWYAGSTANVGSWQRLAQRPSLAEDPNTGRLYCSYQKFDTTAWSSGGYYQGDAFVTVSTDGGQHWAVGRNVTATRSAVNPAPAGQSLSERDITLASRITYSGNEGYLHLEYILDLDAGGIAQVEGTATNNPVYYQRIPVDSIHTTPLVPFYPLRIGDTPAPPTTVTVYPVVNGVRLLWRSTSDPYYKVYSATTYAGPYSTLEATVADTFWVDTAAPVQTPKFYIVRSSTAP